MGATLGPVLRQAVEEFTERRAQRRSDLVLELDLTAPLVEYVPPHPLGRLLSRKRPTVFDVLTSLRQARRDDRVVGLVARIGDPIHSMAVVQEIRDAVRAFADTGKRTVAWAETFGELLPATEAYYLATAFDEIHLQPSGTLGLNGLAAEVTFLTGTLEKVGVQARIGARYEYKNAANIFTETGFTDSHRETIESILGSTHDQIVTGIALGRGIEPARVQDLMDRSPLFATEALDEGLVDRLAYRDETWDAVRKLGRSGDAMVLHTHHYRRRGPGERPKATVALVYGVGAVARGRPGFDPRAGGPVMGADDVSRGLRAAARDDDIAAVVFRVSSPGGSYVASDTVWRETQRFRETGKPLIVSMGRVAGSGGYFVAAGADRILAQPGTLTGSIGVFGGKAVAGDLLERIGLSWEEVQTGAHAGMWSPRRDFSDGEWERVETWLDHVYADFVSKVADGRDMPRDGVERVARGRVWTGSQALEHGLVDELGGMAEAFAAAKRAVDLPEDEPVAVKVLPETSPLEVIGLRTQRNSDDVAARGATLLGGTAARLLSTSNGASRLAGLLGSALDPGVLRMPPPFHDC